MIQQVVKKSIFKVEVFFHWLNSQSIVNKSEVYKLRKINVIFALYEQNYAEIIYWQFNMN